MSHLAGCLSPYLLQHAENPVDWHPWGEQALTLAKSEDKPILLSVGYAACHWCHVMAHESFEDKQTAGIMNDAFVNIKVDREERPDIDYIYQVAHQLMSGRSGGWPLTVFMTPEQIPFFIGTYFPPSAKEGMPSFRQVLAAMSNVWKSHREDVVKQNESVLGALQSIEAERSGPAPLDRRLVTDGAARIAAEFDPVKGGFAGAPKFANPASADFLLSCLSTEKLDKDMKNILNTLDIMGGSGLFDHIGGGFYRYCVDENWSIPHFEKMLYDNGLMLSLYSKAFELTGDKRYREWVKLTADWAIREMQSPEGGFYSSLDADSDGEEGKYYVWDKDELAETLDSDDLQIADELFGLSAAPNFEGRYHLSIREALAGDAKQYISSQGDMWAALAKIRDKLLEKRGKRKRPGLDDKSLASWNALMISGLYRAARALNDDELERSASKALGFVRDKMMDGSGLFASYRKGTAYLDGYLSDYAYLLIASLDSLHSANPPEYAQQMAEQLAGRIVDAFADQGRGGFYFTSDSHEKLIIRFRIGMDDVMPSGNAMAALGLYRLGRLVGEERFLQASRRCLEGFSSLMQNHPRGMASMLGVLAEQLRDD